MHTPSHEEQSLKVKNSTVQLTPISLPHTLSNDVLIFAFVINDFKMNPVS